MENRQRHQRAVEMVQKIARVVESAGWEVKELGTADEFPCVFFTVRYEEAEYPTIAAVNPKTFTLIFVLDLQISYLGDRARELAVAMQLINDNIPIGGFDTFVRYETVCYRMTGACPDLELSEEYLAEKLNRCVELTTTYAPVFEGLATEQLSMREFVGIRGLLESVTEPDDTVTEQAIEVREAICKELEKREIAFETFEDSLMIVVQMPRDGDTMELVVLVDAPMRVIHVHRRLPFKVCGARRLDMATAVTYITSQADEGHFVYDVSAGTVDYRATGFYEDSQAAVNSFLQLAQRAQEQEKAYLEPLRQLNDGELTLRSFRNQV